MLSTEISCCLRHLYAEAPLCCPCFVHALQAILYLLIPSVPGFLLSMSRLCRLSHSCCLRRIRTVCTRFILSMPCLCYVCPVHAIFFFFNRENIRVKPIGKKDKKVQLFLGEDRLDSLKEDTLWVSRKNIRKSRIPLSLCRIRSRHRTSLSSSC